MAKTRKEVFLKTDITIAFSPDRLITTGVPVELEEVLGLKDGDWIVIKKVSPKDVEKKGLEDEFQLHSILPRG